jgi:hypothetical protein
MTIDEAIKNLQDAKTRGVKSIVLAWWSADMLARVDNDDWAHIAERVEEEMDWSNTHEDLLEMANQIMYEEEDEEKKNP